MDLLDHNHYECTMELPITRENLQNYRTYYADVARKKHLEFLATDIYKGVQQVAINNRETKFSYTLGHLLRYCSYINSSSLSSEHTLLTVEELIEFLKEKFIDCTIQTDPLKTYILIDWS